MKGRKINSLSTLMLLMLIISIVGTEIGCSKQKYTPPQLPEWQIAHIISDDPDSLRIYKIDGLLATGTLKGKNVTDLPDSIDVSTSFHEIVPCYLDDVSSFRYGDPIRFCTRQGKKYILKHDIKWDKSHTFWIELNGIDITSD